MFKGAIRECKALQNNFKGHCIITSSANGWMNTEITLDWMNKVVGSLAFRQRVLAWDTYTCHMEDTVAEDLKRKKVDVVFVPEGCTKYIQALDVSWNKPFKAKVQDYYDEWLASTGINRLTESGKLKTPDRRSIIQWILNAWPDLS